MAFEVDRGVEALEGSRLRGLRAMGMEFQGCWVLRATSNNSESHGFRLSRSQQPGRSHLRRSSLKVLLRLPVLLRLRLLQQQHHHHHHHHLFCSEYSCPPTSGSRVQALAPRLSHSSLRPIMKLVLFIIHWFGHVIPHEISKRLNEAWAGSRKHPGPKRWFQTLNRCVALRMPSWLLQL